MSKGFSVAAQYVGGSFVQDLAKELGKSATTVASYLKKHLPATLIKLKNANNRLANFCTADGVAGLRAHYAPAVAPQTDTLVQELERLRAENQQLRARVQELEAAEETGDNRWSKAKDVTFDFDRTRVRTNVPSTEDLNELSTKDLLKYTDKLVTEVSEYYGLPKPRTRLQQPGNSRVIESSSRFINKSGKPV